MNIILFSTQCRVCSINGVLYMYSYQQCISQICSVSVDTVFFVNFQEHQAFHVEFHLWYLLSTFVCLIIFFQMFAWANQRRRAHLWVFVNKPMLRTQNSRNPFRNGNNVQVEIKKTRKKTYHVRLHRTKAYHKNGFLKSNRMHFAWIEWPNG